MNLEGPITVALLRWNQGEEDSLCDLLALVYPELKAMARRVMRDEGNEILQPPTALAHDAFMRLCQGTPVPYCNRKAFFTVCARQMRRLVTDYARRRNARRRTVPLEIMSQPAIISGLTIDQLIDLDAALTMLTENEPRAAQLVDLTFYGGLSQGEAAKVANCSESEAFREIQWALAWLADQLQLGKKSHTPSPTKGHSTASS